MVGNDAIIALAVGAVFGFVIPAAAVILFKLKYKKTSVLSAVIGAACFILFALVLEQILHMVMLPLVTGSTVAFVIYGTLAAGVFEETGRFLTCKFFMKKRSDNADAVMLGLGHGGIEAVILLGITMASYLSAAIMLNSMGFDAFAEMSQANTPELIELLKSQIDTIAACSLPQVLLSILERICAMTLHVSMSVVVMKAASVKGKLWLYPAAVVMHAVFDVPAALYQRGVISSLWLTELILAAEAAAAAVVAVRVSRIRQAEATV